MRERPPHLPSRASGCLKGSKEQLLRSSLLIVPPHVCRAGWAGTGLGPRRSWWTCGVTTLSPGRGTRQSVPCSAPSEASSTSCTSLLLNIQKPPSVFPEPAGMWWFGVSDCAASGISARMVIRVRGRSAVLNIESSTDSPTCTSGAASDLSQLLHTELNAPRIIFFTCLTATFAKCRQSRDLALPTLICSRFFNEKSW